MLKKILVPLDGSALAEQALSYAAELSVPTGATLLVMRAAYSHTLPGVDSRERKDGAIREAEAYLATTAAAFTARGYICRTLVPFGHPAECIIEQARLSEVNLIAMTTHGRTGAGRLLLGSVAESVVARSPVPVLVTRAWLPPRRQPFLPEQPLFIVPLDGSAFAETALGPAISLADDMGAGLMLLRAEASDGSLEDALDYLATVRERLHAEYPDLSVLTYACLGHPAEAINNAFGHSTASHVIMATHGRGGIMRSVTGSVAGQVLKEGRAPLVLVRPAAHPGELTQAAVEAASVV
jgi:nucleotide-binding universal stress UspA family protein